MAERSDFPGNAHRPRREASAAEEKEKIVASVVQSKAVSRKKSIGKRMKETLLGGDTDSVMNYIVQDVIVPQIKELIAEAVSQGIERLVHGDGRGSSRRSRSAAPVNYNRYSRPSSMTSNAREPVTVRRHRMDDIILKDRLDAQRVLEGMEMVLEKYQTVTVADLYSLVKWSSTHTDGKWGWDDLDQASIQRIREGYIINLPEPEYLD